MNLIQQAEELKNLPDQVLTQMSQGQGMIPPYLVMSEMKRREEMRKAYTAQKGGDPVQRRTVMEEMRERFNPMAAPPQGQPQAGQVAPNAPAPRMAKGGLTAVDGFIRKLSGGTEEDDYPMEQDVDPLAGLPINTQTLPQLYANRTFTPDDAPLGVNDLAITGKQLDSRWGSTAEQEAAAKKFMESRKSSRLEGVAERLAQMEQNARGKKADIGQILMQLGLGMAASRRPDFAGAVGEGGLAALHGYTQQKALNNAQADNFLKQRLGVLEAQQQSDDVATRSGDDYLRALIAARNTSMGTGEASLRAQQHAAQVEREGELARNTQLKIAADRIKAEAALADRKNSAKYDIEEEAIKDWMKRNPGKSVMEAVAALGVAKNAGKPVKVGKGDKGGNPLYKEAKEHLHYADTLDKHVESLLKQSAEVGDKTAADALRQQAMEIQDKSRQYRQRGDEMMAQASGFKPPPKPPQQEPQFIIDPNTGKLIPNPKLAKPTEAPAASTPTAMAFPTESVMGGLRGMADKVKSMSPMDVAQYLPFVQILKHSPAAAVFNKAKNIKREDIETAGNTIYDRLFPAN